MASRSPNKAAVLRGQLRGERPILVAGAHDGLSAKLIERAGFDAVWASGFGISAVRALPAANILTMSETLIAAREMDEACNIPVIADCDNGFGNAINVMRTAEQYSKVGIAGICLEDNIFPKRCSFYAGVQRELVPAEEHAQKIRAARSSAVNDEFVVIARTEALIAGWGMAEALERARAYADAGADAILIHSKEKSFDEIREFTRQWDRDVPLVSVPTTYAQTTVDELFAHKFRLIIFANQAIRASIRAMREVLATIKEKGFAASADDSIVTLPEVYDLVGVSELRESEKSYLTASEAQTRAVIIAAGFEPSLMPLIEEKPKAMLEVRGRTILERQIEALNACGVRDIAVVRGYRKEMINPPGVRCYDNDDYERTGELASLWAAREELKGRVLFLYSDILFDTAILEKLLKSPAEVSLVVDRAWRDNHQASPPKLPHDLVVTESAGKGDKGDKGGAGGKAGAAGAKGDSFRFLPAESPAKIRKIGQAIPAGEADGEFIGLALLSSSGAARLRALGEELFAKPPQGKFHDVSSFAKASFTDVVQELIDRGAEVAGVEIYKGWQEVDTFEDYRRAWGRKD